MAEVLSALNARVKEVLAALTDRVDNGEILLAEHGKQLLDVLNGIPASSAAACAVLLHGFEDVFGFVADEAVVNVDHDQRRTLAVANALAVTGCLKHRLVLLSNKLIPDSIHLVFLLRFLCFLLRLALPNMQTYLIFPAARSHSSIPPASISSFT